ncbi:MAG: hypothetical protein M1393_04615 [Candidatus Thermoplasmatota archaeon]|nr:hypothetical protein [Candidatus Thermoplasmatota archaeon]MDA8143736.1 hypothetical protein [Thermoplasmatales archaeon]
MYSLVFLEVVLTFSIAAVMSFIAYVWLSRLFSSMRITKKQLLKTLPTALILPAIPLTLFILFNPQHVNMAEPLTYAWELIFFSGWIFLVTCRAYFLHFGKKNMGTLKNIVME